MATPVAKSGELPEFKVLRLVKVNHVGELWLANPDKLNAMGPDFWRELPEAIRALDADPAVRVILIKAEGRAFTAGLDLMSMGGGLSSAGGKSGQRLDFYHHIRELQSAVAAAEKARKPVIAAIHGHCIGGGVDLATACDIRLATAGSKWSVREVHLAITADVGTLQRLPRIVGRGIAMELALTGRDFDGAYAKEIHLVSETYDSTEELHKAADEMAQTIASHSPLAVQGTKNVLLTCEEMNIDEGLNYVAVWNSAFLASDDLTEAVTAFMQKRKPEFKGR